ncbi:MAG: EcoRI family type II restriction endonuclease [Cyanobium sp. MAG06]|nr:EcoRI family type II restriction endonuclease [Cyanobium sp. MAG06]
MANSKFLRNNKTQHKVKNNKSKKMDKDICVVIDELIIKLQKEYPKLQFELIKRIFLKDIITNLKVQFPNYSHLFSKVQEKSFIKPDGGFLYSINEKGERRVILITEVKRQGTNDERKKEGLKKQARGNAIERLGKNVTGIRAMNKNSGALPFVCFGSGDDFKDTETIKDRVVTINEFFPLNEIFIQKNYLPFEPVSLFFRQKQ